MVFANYPATNVPANPLPVPERDSFGCLHCDGKFRPLGRLVRRV